MKVEKILSSLRADFSDTKWNGKSCVYVWVDDRGNPFYVGSGSKERAFCRSGRRYNLDFMQRSECNCKVIIIADNLSRIGVFDVERQTIRYMVRNKICLAQKAYKNLDPKYGSIIPVPLIKEMCLPAWEDICKCISA